MLRGRPGSGANGRADGVVKRSVSSGRYPVDRSNERSTVTRKVPYELDAVAECEDRYLVGRAKLAHQRLPCLTRLPDGIALVHAAACIECKYHRSRRVGVLSGAKALDRQRPSVD